MFETIKKPKNTQLAFNLLKILNEKYACANEIKQKLKSRHINYIVYKYSLFFVIAIRWLAEKQSPNVPTQPV